ncbi:hypothetical protein [Hydrogenimonas sp.]
MRRTLTTLAALAWAATSLLAGLPDYKTLCHDLPDLSGWQADECEGMKMTNPMFGEVVSASRSYTKGDATLQVMVVSGMQAMMMWGPYQSGTTIETDEGFMKLETIDGFPVGISYDKASHSGGIVVQIAPNAVLGIDFQNMGWQEALELAKKMDWQGLKAAFSSSAPE